MPDFMYAVVDRVRSDTTQKLAAASFLLRQSRSDSRTEGIRTL